MAVIRTKEEQAEALAHLLDDVLRMPGTRMRMGLDPLIGLIPVVGDAIVTVMGAPILLIALQLNVPWRIVVSMGVNQLKNGLIGAVPLFGDAYSFHFKSNAINAALLLRTIKRGQDGVCQLTPRSITVQDIAGLVALLLPMVALIGYVSYWFWSHNISYIAFFFPPPYQSR